MVIFVVSGGRADAQERRGLMGGFSLGGGAVNVSGASADPATQLVTEGGGQGAHVGANLFIGVSTSPRTAVLFEVAIAGVAEDAVVDGEVRVGTDRVTFPMTSSSLTSSVFGGAVQYWLTSRVWVRGGLGAGYIDRDLLIGPADLTVTLSKSLGFATMGAAGVDIWRRGNFAIDGQFHFTWLALEGVRIQAPTGQVGLTWY
jgi:hypothetical protein